VLSDFNCLEVNFVLSLIGGFLTLTVSFTAFLLPSFAFAVMVTVPALIPLTTPFELTVATFLLLEE
jgi:hypothetical protein